MRIKFYSCQYLEVIPLVPEPGGPVVQEECSHQDAQWRRGKCEAGEWRQQSNLPPATTGGSWCSRKPTEVECNNCKNKVGTSYKLSRSSRKWTVNKLPWKILFLNGRSVNDLMCDALIRFIVGCSREESRIPRYLTFARPNDENHRFAWNFSANKELQALKERLKLLDGLGLFLGLFQLIRTFSLYCKVGWKGCYWYPWNQH